MIDQTLTHVYGPVPSRRLGRSLGIDLVPYKTCTYDCIYCQLGRTTNKTVEWKEYTPFGDVLSEIECKLAAGPAPHYITLSGSGEPTLYSRLGELIRAIKQRTKIPLAVLTNGSLLWDAQVREALQEADLVMPSLDAGDERLFRYVNRPHPSISFEQMAQGIEEFRKGFSKDVWLEVFLLAGVTATEREVAKVARIARRIKPDRIQLNTVVRPPSDEYAYAVPREQMEQFLALFAGRAELIADFRDTRQRTDMPATDEDILGLLSRRPCTLRDIADGLGLYPSEVVKRINRLMKDKLVVAQSKDNRPFYKVINGEKRKQS